MSKFWTKTFFWDRLTKTLAIFGMPSGALAAYIETDPFWLAISVFSGIGIALIAVWMTDHDKNGIIDLFEKDK